MANHPMKTFTCPVCHQEKRLVKGVPAELISAPMLGYIQKTVPGWAPEAVLCHACLDRLRTEYIQHVIEEERQELDSLRKQTARSLAKQEAAAQNINVLFEKKLTFGQHIADKVADFGGSWPFIGLFFLILMAWIGINALFLAHPFDPYPFILLNLLLSSLAALQAPIIMMSQNRQEDKDRLRGEYDYRVNLKAELEIRHLHAKMDMLLSHQWQRLLEIQQIQTDLMEEIVRHRAK